MFISARKGFTPFQIAHLIFYSSTKVFSRIEKRLKVKTFFERLETGFTLTEIAFIVLIIAIFIVLLTPFINKIRTRTNIINCEENLEKISLGLKLYASEHQEKFPPNLSALTEGGYVEDEKVFDCPSSPNMGDALEPDYHYTTGHTVMSNSDTEIVFDKAGNHEDGKHVLYISGDIVWLAGKPVSR